MNLRLGFLGVILFLGEACSQEPTQPATTDELLAGTYALAEVDGAPLPCCSQHVVDSVSKTETWGAGELKVLPDSTFTWTVVLQSQWTQHPADITELRDTVIATGAYSQSSSGLVFHDSAKPMEAFSGTATGDTVNLTRGAHRYVFVLEPPPSITGLWGLAECTDLAGGSPGCPATDSSGTVETITGGSLEISGGPSAGHYLWTNQISLTSGEGTTTSIARVFSEGTYTWNDTLLVISDSTDVRGPITGHFDGGPLVLRLRTPTQMFLFSKAPSPPHG